MPYNYQRKGNEVLVNTVTDGDQIQSEIAHLQDGGFIIVWSDGSAEGNDTSHAGIKAQRFDAAGNEVGSEFSINTTTFGFQLGPRVVELVSGKFVVIWTDTNAPTESVANSDVRGQLFNADGTPSGSEFVVSTNTANSQRYAGVTALADGGFVATWSDSSGVGGDASGQAVKAQVFDADGGKVGGEFLVNTATAGNQNGPSVIGLASGGFVVSWANMPPPGGQSSISLQIFDGSGARIGAEQVVSTDNRGIIARPVIAALDSGFVVVWEQAVDFEGNASSSDLKAQRFDATGGKIGGEIFVNTDLQGDQISSDVTGLPGGGFLVTWERFQQEPDFTVRAQAFDADGVRRGEFTVSTVTQGFQSVPAIATLSSGDVVITWSDDSGVGGDASGYGIKMQILSDVGTPPPPDEFPYEMLASIRPADAVLSPDGSRIFVAGSDGFLKVYDVATGALLHNWDVGTQLGGIDVAYDGSYVVVTEQVPLSNDGYGWDSEREITLYKVDTATGAVTSFPYTAVDYDSTFSDVAVLPDDKVLLTQNFMGSGWTELKVLDLTTGSYTEGASVRNSSILHRARDGSSVLIAEWDISDAPLHIYDPASGIIHTHGLYADGVSGYNLGFEAYSAEGGLVAQYLPGNGLHVYDATLDYQRDLATFYPQWNEGAVSGLAFSQDGASLFVLDNVANAIVELSTSNWVILQTIPLDFEVGEWSPNDYSAGDYGNRLLVSADGRYLTVVTETAFVIVADPTELTVTGTSDADTLGGTLFAETLDGLGGDDTLRGHGGNDVINGGAGNDYLDGGLGNDTYIVDNGGDTVIEAAGGGADIIYSSISYSLNDASEVENLSTITWENNDPLNLTGNSLANTLIGNAGANQLNGAGGADIMFGREGNDTYIVDNEADQAVEYAGQGSDIIYTAVSYTLAANTDVEALATLSFEGTGAINLTGNGLANTLIGNDGNNQLDGKGGADVMVGRAGGDIYLVDHATDAIFESVGGGYDVIYSAVSFALTNDQEIEGLSTITWELTTAVDLTGNSADNYLIGNAGSNVLDGKGGNDVLQGREGTDIFAFTTVPAAGNADLILDFSAADDTIRLEGAAFGGLAPGSLDPDAFVVGTAAQDGEDRIVYDQATGRLFFDADGNGNGAAVLFATLQGAPVITAGDFAMI